MIVSDFSSKKQRLPVDVLIVGAGAVGIALAVRLARIGKHVTVLEGGAQHPRTDYQKANTGVVTGLPHRGLTEGRMKALGGTTRLWGGQLVPFGPADFAGGEGRPAWPVTHVDMLPYFEQAFGFFGIDPDATDDAAIWRRASGMPPSLGEHLRLGMNIWLPQPDFARLFADDIETLPNLSVYTDAEVRTLVTSEDGRRIVAVETAGGDGETRRFSAPDIVLANGTFEIVRLLLRTAALSPGCGFADNPNIGKGFIDHMHGYAGSIEITDATKLSRLFDNIYFQGRKYGVKIRATDRFREQQGIANCAATINARASIGVMVRDLATLGRRLVVGRGFREIGGSIRSSLTLARIILPIVWRYVVQRRSTSLFSEGVFLGLELEQLPTPKSYLTLDPDSPPETAPIALHWGFDGREMEAAATMCEELAAVFAEEGIGRITVDPRILARDPAFLETCHDANHQMGGACMAATADTGVVDRDLKVFGIDNLYVLGAAVYPSGSFANPTLTALALAMRLAERLAGPIRC